MELPFDPEDLPTPEELKKWKEAIVQLNAFLIQTSNQVMEDQISTGGGVTPEFAAQKQQQHSTHAQLEQLMQLRSEAQEIMQRLEDIQLVVGESVLRVR